MFECPGLPPPIKCDCCARSDVTINYYGKFIVFFF